MYCDRFPPWDMHNCNEGKMRNRIIVRVFIQNFVNPICAIYIGV